MIIRYDYQIFSMQDYGGISRYFSQLIRRISMLPDVTAGLNIFFSHNHYLKGLKDCPHKRWLENRSFPGVDLLIRILKKMNKVYNLAEVKRGDFTIYHPTYYNTEFLPFIGKKPFVLTVYDMVHELYPHMFKNKDIAEQKKALINKASKVIAISKNTRKDIVRFYPVAADKIDVVHLSHSLEPDVPCETKMILPEKYILFVGNRNTYKNFTFFIQSIAQLLVDDNGLSVVCAGGEPFSAQELNFFRGLDLLNRVNYVPIQNDNELVHVYTHALFFVFPSLYEGFGIPVLESFACGCPVLASNTSSLPEVGGDAARYVDPRNSVSLIEGCGDLLEKQSVKGEGDGIPKAGTD